MKPKTKRRLLWGIGIYVVVAALYGLRANIKEYYLVENCIDNPGDKSIVECVEAEVYSLPPTSRAVSLWLRYSRMGPHIDTSKKSLGSWVEYMRVEEANNRRGFELLLNSPDAPSLLKASAIVFLEQNRNETISPKWIDFDLEGKFFDRQNVPNPYGAARFEMEEKLKISPKEFVLADRVCGAADLPVAEAVATDCVRREIRYSLRVWAERNQDKLDTWKAEAEAEKRRKAEADRRYATETMAEVYERENLEALRQSGLLTPAISPNDARRALGTD